MLLDTYCTLEKIYTISMLAALNSAALADELIIITPRCCIADAWCNNTKPYNPMR